ncbi:gag-pol polyprotein [Cucumis melo var. makuwa]|uniref:Gag-pol polyprotein n=1 Tax=Cucumis melo var. makuwa TaxID=1194695 RepID=A0A5D3DV15_CUCMM|nr:gag-pol polyprotein [Cucumis melo var. makuwa]TYK27338.1 gag-pol polyprotein [Cucumis melo var. makuwa]
MSQFEGMKMGEDQSLSEYNVNILDITNASFLLGERIPESKLVRKFLPSLPQRFNMKVTAIEKANDITKMKLDELFGSLKTFELTLGNGDSRRKNGMAFSTVSEENARLQKETLNKESLAESIALLTKQVSKLKNQFYKHVGINKSQNFHDNSFSSYSSASNSFS